MQSKRNLLRNTVVSLVLTISLAQSQEPFWQKIYGAYGKSVRSFRINSDGFFFVGTTDSGVFRSTDNGISWAALDKDAKLRSVQALEISPKGDIFVSATDSELYYFSNLHRSTDKGNTWTRLTNGLPFSNIYSIGFNLRNHVLLGHMDDLHFWVGEIFRSADNGLTWSRGYYPSPVRGFSKSLDSLMFGATIHGSLARSTNDGESFSKVTYGLTDDNFTSVVISSYDTIFAGSSGGGVFRSTDEGNTWSPAGLGGSRISTLIVVPNGLIYAGTSGDGVYYSEDNGNNWHRQNSGLDNLDITSFAVDKKGYLYVGTEGGGIYLSHQSQVTSVPTPLEIPVAYSLSQNYPNPFNPSTTIQFDLPKKNLVTLEVYNLIGEKVAILVNGELPAGRHIVNWTPANLSTGVYFYRLQAEAFVSLRKLIYLK